MASLHFGIAPGIDRIVMLLAGATNLRDLNAGPAKAAEEPSL
jgi:aspartyl-tRNA synthetase